MVENSQRTKVDMSEQELFLLGILQAVTCIHKKLQIF